MAYRFKISETPQHAVRRLGCEQIDRAMRALTAAELSGGAVHETRKCLKRIRALLRLVRPGLTGEDFQRENSRFREIGRLLSPARDAQILTETLLKLEPYADPAANAALAVLKQHIGAAMPAAGVQPNSATIATAREHLLEGRASIAKLTVTGTNFGAVESGLMDGYRKGLELFERTYRSGTDETFHEWRKCVQLHWRHMALLLRAWPDMLTARVEAARQLSQILGEAQDLAVLLHHIDTLPPGTLAKADQTRLVRLARKRQTHLRALAEPRGAQLFSLSPKALARSVMESWHAARALDDLTDKKLAATAAPKPPADEESSAPHVSATGPHPGFPAVPQKARAAKRKRTKSPA